MKNLTIATAKMKPNSDMGTINTDNNKKTN